MYIYIYCSLLLYGERILDSSLFEKKNPFASLFLESASTTRYADVSHCTTEYYRKHDYVTSYIYMYVCMRVCVNSLPNPYKIKVFIKSGGIGNTFFNKFDILFIQNLFVYAASQLHNNISQTVCNTIKIYKRIKCFLDQKQNEKFFFSKLKQNDDSVKW